MKSLKSLKEPEGVPIGKPFTITFAVHLGDSAGDKELKNATKKESTEAVTKHFIEKYAREFNKEVRTISSYAMELLMDYAFPGNIRELENIIERSVAMESSNIILPENLLFSTLTNFNVEIPDKGINLNEELEKIEKKFIEKALQKAKGSKTRAGELLHVTFDSLRYRIEKLGIE